MQHPEKRKSRAPRRRNRRKRALILTVGIAALAAAVLLLLPELERLFPGEQLPKLTAEQPYRTLDEGNASVLSSIGVTHADGESYTLLYRDERLYLEGENGENMLINESYIEAIVEAATSISVEDTVTMDESEVADALADMGLDPAQITVDVRYADGRTVRIELGARAPETTYYYYRWSGDNGVYLCAAGVYEAFEYTAHMLLAVEQPVFTAELIERVTLLHGDEPPIDVSFAADARGMLQSPYAYPMDATASENLVKAVVNFRLGTLLEEVTPENRADYGFDSPSVIVEIRRRAGSYSEIDASGVLQTYQTEAAVVRLTLGAPDGDYFYYCEYAGSCYRVSAFLVKLFVAATADSLVTRAPADMGDATLSAITAQVGGGVMDMRITRTERVLENNQLETDTDGNVLYDASVTVNGEAVAEEVYTALVARLAQMTVSGDAIALPTGTPSWQLTLATTDGVTRVIAGYPMDAFSDIVAVNGVAKHYVNGEALRIALGDLYPGK